jgi:hypothetical protein
MRFTWIALPIVLVALSGAGTASDAAPLEDGKRDRHTERDYAAATVSPTAAAPIVALPSPSGESQLLRLFPAVKVRRGLPLGGDPPGTRRTLQARVMIRTVDRAGLAFIPEVNRATTGFLSSSTTACPPPSIR